MTTNRPANTPSRTICWTCANAVPDGKRACPWSVDQIPVRGWKTEPPRHHDYGKSYTVIECPMYVQDTETTMAEANERLREMLDEMAKQAKESKGRQIRRHWVDEYWTKDGM